MFLVYMFFSKKNLTYLKWYTRLWIQILFSVINDSPVKRTVWSHTNITLLETIPFTVVRMFIKPEKQKWRTSNVRECELKWNCASYKLIYKQDRGKRQVFTNGYNEIFSVRKWYLFFVFKTLWWKGTETFTKKKEEKKKQLL